MNRLSRLTPALLVLALLASTRHSPRLTGARPRARPPSARPYAASCRTSLGGCGPTWAAVPIRSGAASRLSAEILGAVLIPLGATAHPPTRRLLQQAVILAASS